MYRYGFVDHLVNGRMQEQAFGSIRDRISTPSLRTEIGVDLKEIAAAEGFVPDIMDEPVVVGGLVPSLLVNQRGLPTGTDSHVGTMDLDMGLVVEIAFAK